MDFYTSVKTAYNRSLDFRRRAGRPEFWWFMLFQAVADLVASQVPVLDTAWFVLNVVPATAVAARRLHDTDRSGWWQLLPVLGLPLILVSTRWLQSLAYLAFIGLEIVIVVWFATPGTPGPNRFGPDPRSYPDADVFS